MTIQDQLQQRITRLEIALRKIAALEVGPGTDKDGPGRLRRIP